MIILNKNRGYKYSVAALLASLLGSSWLENRSHILSESNDLAGILCKIFRYSVHLAWLPAKLAMRANLPVWRKFVESVDEALETIRRLVPKMVILNGDGLLQAMVDKGVVGEELLRIVIDLIIAAGDTVRPSIQ